MFDSVREFYDEVLLNWSIIQQAMAPLRLTRWQMFKLFMAELYRDNPVLMSLVVLSMIASWASVITKLIQVQKGAFRTNFSVSKSRMEQKTSTHASELHRNTMEGTDDPRVVDKDGYRLVVYPPKFFDEIKRIPESEASAQDYFRTISHGYLGNETHALLKTIAIDLSRNIPLKVPLQQDFTRVAFDKYLGYCREPKSVALFDLMVKIYASSFSSLLGGRQLSEGDWPVQVQQVFTFIYHATKTLDRLPRLLRPIARLLSSLTAARIQRRMRKTLEPIIRRDIESYEHTAHNQELPKPSTEDRLPFTQWLMSRYEQREVTHSLLLADYLNICIFSAIKCASLLSSIILELALRPELQDELCREVESVLVNGHLPSTHLKELRKMDSVMREVSRVHAFSPYALCRQTRQTFQLSSGPVLQPGTIICVDAYHINNSAERHSKPALLDPNRFLTKRAEHGTANSHQFVNTGPNDPNWGDGIQVCPGRFVANSSLKVCLAHLVTTYRVMPEASTAVEVQVLEEMRQPSGLFSPEVASKVSFQSRR